ncbi:MAG: GTP-binding protein [Candidatus Pacebacteria bacterium]|nr:GTP-binding protein [Candidatus Paceibacterota bacterium]
MATGSGKETKVEDAHEEYSDPDLNFKVILIGETGVGKTCIMLRASRDEFKEEHTVTLGADFTNYYLNINGKSTKLQMWDTCGLEMYKSMIRVFFKGSDAAFLVFDVTNEKTFTTLPLWLKELREFTSPDVLCYLIGNKIDMPHRAVSRSDAEAFVAKYQLTAYHETSAKSGAGIKPLIHKMAEQLYLKKGGGKKPEGVSLEDGGTRTEGGCQC